VCKYSLLRDRDMRFLRSIRSNLKNSAGYGIEPSRKGRPPTLHAVLFILTLFSTFLVGWESGGIINAIYYSFGIVTILLTHEMGHYLMAKKHGVPATLPYFIPIPFGPFGTLGAVIKMQGRIPDRRALFDIGVAGPMAGIAVIIPIILVGLAMSEVKTDISSGGGVILLGDSMLFSFLAWIAKGSLSEGQDIILHPLAYAGWVGLLVTSINLLPVGQLDGGHIVYALFWKKSNIPSAFFYGLFFFIFLFYYIGWILLIILLAIFRRHPPTMYDHLPVDRKRKVIGGIALAIFILSFTPVPFVIGDGLIPILVREIFT